MPALALPATDGSELRVDVVPPPATRLVLYAYPRTGRPGVEPPPGWDLIPGARGCTPQACAFRDHTAELASSGAVVVGLSTQDTVCQREAVERLHLPFLLLSDADLALTRALRLPTFEVAGVALLRRLTLVVRDGAIEHVFYPVFPPDRHVRVVLDWLVEHPVR
ncbi:peroxiredoxin [Micromonospora carbonacea]|uniref:peroxiredoxin n=1 Tax=Micromonospora carbonacea TaxID=47853 RepID=UPI003719B560